MLLWDHSTGYTLSFLFCSVYLFEVTKVAIIGWKVQVVAMTYFFFFIVLWHVCKAKSGQVKWSHGSRLKILKVKWFLNSKSWKSVWLKLYVYCMWCYKYSFASWWFSIICGGLLGRLKTPLGVLSVFLHLVSLRLVFILTPATSQMMHSVGCGWKVSATTVSFGRSLSCVNAKTGSWEMELLLDFLNRLCDITSILLSVLSSRWLAGGAQLLWSAWVYSQLWIAQNHFSVGL